MESEKQISKFAKALKDNPYWILILAAFAVVKIIQEIVKLINVIPSLKSLSVIPILNWDFFGYVMQVVTVYVLYRLYRGYLRAKRQIKEYNDGLAGQINVAFEYTTNNLNDSHNKLYKTIKYVDLKTEFNHLDNDSFIKKLHEAGFSKDDLSEIGVNEAFLKTNENKLLPKSVIEKYQSFKTELDSHLKKK